jgi:hypothetical protein
LLINFSSCLAFIFNSEIETQRNYLESCRDRERGERAEITERPERPERADIPERAERERARKKTMMTEKEDIGL